MPNPDPTYTFPVEAIESAELAVSAVLPDETQAALAVKITLAVAATAVDQVIADADEMISTSMGVNAKFAEKQAEADEILAEVKDWYARAQTNGDYSSELTDLGRLLTSHAQTQDRVDDGDKDFDSRSITDKFIIEFDKNAGLALALDTAHAGLADARTVLASEPQIPLPTKAKLQRIITGARTWPDDSGRDAWDSLAAARAGAVAHIEFLIDQMPAAATFSQLRENIQQWRAQDFAAAVPDLDRDIHVVLAQLVDTLDNTHFVIGVTAEEAMRYVRDSLLPHYRQVALRS